ncbi:UV-damaged DNA binding protein [Phascolomyces articulosus]|uniref:DNA damage-binding protein 1 n=1 Tax=Phascolomyces articulosus TaxID=60185 RepID=A0AAD5JYS6_9FUNG|nr:UV-damaged DNA binding protein [Phascolomyces articulosus]
MSVLNYVSTAQAPTAIHCTARGNFLVPHEECLIVSKSTRVEIYKANNTGLTLELEFGVFGRIESLAVCNASPRERCSLFVLTDQDQYCVLSYDPTSRSIVTDSSGKLDPEITRPVEDPIITTAGTNKEIVIASVYGGFLHVFPIQPPKNSKGKGRAVTTSNQPFSVRISESQIQSMVVLNNTERPTVAILYMDEKEIRRVKIYEINISGRELFGKLLDGLVEEFIVDSSDQMLAAVPSPFGGILVIGELMISYYDMHGWSRSTSINSMIPTAHAFLGPGSTECLLGDSFGNLHHLTMITNSNNTVTELSLTTLGKTAVASSITYLDNSLMFIGSTLGDSVLIQIKEIGVHFSFSVIYEMSSLSPIVDFCVYDLDKRGRQTMVCCSGGPNNGSLRVVQEGVGFIEQASLPIHGIKKLWALKTGLSADHDDVLVIATIHETRVLYTPPGGKVMEELEQFSAMRLNETTLTAGPVSDGKFIQVTPSSVRLLKSEVTSGLLNEWQPPSSDVITVAAANATQCVLSYGNGTLVYLEVSGDTLVQKSLIEFDNEISCLDINPLDDGSITFHANYLAVGLWGGESLQLVRLPDLHVIAKDTLPEKLVPRSVLLVNLSETHYLMVTLGDGQMISYNIDNDGSLSSRQEITLGTHSVSLHVIPQNGMKCVFAASDHPTMISCEYNQLVFSAVNLKDVRSCATFDSSIMRQSMALCTSDKLIFGNVDPVRKLHFTKIPLDNQMGQRLAYHEQSKTIAVGTSKTIRNPDNGIEYSKGWLRIFDARTFQVLDSHELLEQEQIESITTAYIDDLEQEFVFVGTAITHNEEETQLTGRVLAFHISSTGDYKLVDAFKVPGVVYCIKPFMGSIVAAVEGSLYYLEKLKLDEEMGNRLALDIKLHANVEALSIDTRGEFILVGDMIRSMSLVKLQDPSNTIFQKVAADYNPCWMTNVKILQDDIFLGAETFYNLFTARRVSDMDVDDESDSPMHLEIVGEYHLGDQVNCFREGSLTQSIKPRNQNKPPVTKVLYATANGAIGTVRSLTDQDYAVLSAAQTNILSVVKSIGDFDHRGWRMFKNSSKASEMRNFIDGDVVESFFKLSEQEKQKVIQGQSIQGQDGLRYNVQELESFIRELITS